MGVFPHPHRLLEEEGVDFMPREFLGVKYFIRIDPDMEHVYQQFENVIEREWRRGVRSAEALGSAVTTATGGYTIGRNEIYAIVRELKRRDEENAT